MNMYLVCSNVHSILVSQAVAYGTSALLYMLSRDRQIDISKAMLGILLKLADPLEKKTTSNAKEKGL